MNESIPNCQKLEDRLIALHEGCLDLIRETSLESLLKHIAHIASRQVPSLETVVAVHEKDGAIVSFPPDNSSSILVKPHSRQKTDLLKELINQSASIRIPMDGQRSSFADTHQEIKSLLFVPIRRENQNLGLIYLSERASGCFNDEDQRIIEMLAAYAAVALTNTRLYRELVQHDQTLARRNENLALLNQLAVTLASSLDTDQILQNALSQVMEYLGLEVGEVFLRQEDSNELQLVIHRGSLVKKLWVKDNFQIGEGIVGMVAASGQVSILELPAAESAGLIPEVPKKCFKQVAMLPVNRT